jgi:hypothetical protein
MLGGVRRWFKRIVAIESLGDLRVVAEVGVGAVQHAEVGLEGGVSVVFPISLSGGHIRLPCLRHMCRCMLALPCATHHSAGGRSCL